MRKKNPLKLQQTMVCFVTVHNYNIINDEKKTKKSNEYPVIV